MKGSGRVQVTPKTRHSFEIENDPVERASRHRHQSDPYKPSFPLALASSSRFHDRVREFYTRYVQRPWGFSVPAKIQQFPVKNPKKNSTQTNKQTNEKQASKQASKQTNKQTSKQTSSQASKQTNKASKETGKQAKSNKQTPIFTGNSPRRTKQKEAQDENS